MFLLTKTFRLSIVAALFVCATSVTHAAFPWRKAFFTASVVSMFADLAALNRLYTDHACSESVQEEVESSWSTNVKLYRNLLAQYDATATEQINKIAAHTFGAEFAHLDEYQQEQCMTCLCDNPTVELQVLLERILAIEEGAQNMSNRRNAYEETKEMIESKIKYAKCAIAVDAILASYLGYTLYRQSITA